MTEKNITLNLNKNSLFTNELLLLSNSSLGNILKFTHSNSYENIKGLNFTNNAILDVNKITQSLRRSLKFLQNVKTNKGLILFIGTRPDIRKITEKLGSETNMPYINQRWLKGLLTNWENSSSSVKFYNLFLKKLGLSKKKKLRMMGIFEGLQELTRLPDAIIILDPITDIDAMQEAKTLNIPVIAIADTGISLDDIDYPILGNNESLISLTFFSNLILETLKINK